MLPLLRRRRGAAFYRERNQHAAHLWRPQPHAVRERQLSQLPHPRSEGIRESREEGDQGGGPLPAERSRRREPGGAAAPVGGRSHERGEREGERSLRTCL